jgi:hypothetical protein
MENKFKNDNKIIINYEVKIYIDESNKIYLPYYKTLIEEEEFYYDIYNLLFDNIKIEIKLKKESNISENYFFKYNIKLYKDNKFIYEFKDEFDNFDGIIYFEKKNFWNYSIPKTFKYYSLFNNDLLINFNDYLNSIKFYFYGYDNFKKIKKYTHSEYNREYYLEYIGDKIIFNDNFIFNKTFNFINNKLKYLFKK